jgi:hypothetical protein
MSAMRTAAFTALIITLGAAGWARPQDEKEVTPAEFRKAVPVFMDDPSSDKGKAAARTILLFTLQSKDVVVVVGKEESAWFGLKKDGKDEKAGHYMTAKSRDTILMPGCFRSSSSMRNSRSKTRTTRTPSWTSFAPRKRTASSKPIWKS